ncbi:MAG: glycyl-radical enzyme activating protein [Anaerobacillus sp.]|uniref:glycyl-radical enzyme activating protein n=1 Tax=Anaerobacillus sp. TaxID=1872506 RepID=UPI00391A6E13
MEKIDYSKKGVVFNIQKFSVHDGPGIRTIVFLKGCPLRCLWCCNPESQDPKPTADFGKEMTVEEVIEELKKDAVHYRRSGGGITISGGEPLMQDSFVIELLKACKVQGWHTAMETTGLANEKVLTDVIPLLDLVLLDVKGIEFDVHEKFTGISSKPLLKNSIVIGNLAKEIAIRIPVIPTFNADEKSIDYICQFVKHINRVSRVHLLPYHNYGENKYEVVGKNYEMKEIPSLSIRDLKDYQSIVEKHGFMCVIGG